MSGPISSTTPQGIDFRGRSRQVDRQERPVVTGLNRSVSLESSVSRKIPQSTADLAGKPLMERSVSLDTGLARLTGSEPPKGLMTSDELLQSAGQTKQVLGMTVSKGYGDIVGLVTRYGAMPEAGVADKMQSLATLEDKIVQFLNQKATKNQGKLTGGQERRMTGLKQLLTSIGEERKALAGPVVAELAMNRGGGANPRTLLQGQTVNTLLQGVREQDPALRGHVINMLVADLVGVGKSTQAAELVLAAIQSGDVAKDDPSVSNAINNGVQGTSLADASANLAAFYNGGILNARVISDVSQPLSIVLNNEFADTPQGVQELVGRIDWALLEGTPLASLQQDIANNGPIHFDRVHNAATQLQYMQQARAVVATEFLQAAASKPGLSGMIKAWLQLYDHGAIRSYNESLPSSKQHIDILDAAFADETAKLDVEYFESLAAGDKSTAASKGWHLIGEGWQTTPGMELMPRDKVLSDYFAHHAQGAK